MTKNVRYLTLAILVFGCWMTLIAQTTLQDILYLKNGSIIKGTIIEFIPDSTVKIRTADSSLFVFPSLEIMKIQKEEVNAPIETKLESKTKRKDSSIKASIFGGVAIPGSDFGIVAETGFTFGMQLHSKKQIGVLFNISYSSNPSPGDESWSSFIILLGLKTSLQKTETTDLYIAPVFGLYLQKIGGLSASAVAYGAMIGYQVNERIGFGSRIVGSNPEYNGYFNLSTSMVHVFIALGL